MTAAAAARRSCSSFIGRRLPADDVGALQAGRPAAAAVAMTTCGHRPSRVNQYVCGDASQSYTRSVYACVETLVTTAACHAYFVDTRCVIISNRVTVAIIYSVLSF